VKKTSGAFIMVRGEEKYVFADCAINIAPSAQDLAESAMVSAQTARVFGIDPKVALLSFSTKGSAVSPETEKVVEALEVLKGMNPDFAYDGELQFDAAFVPSVASKKAPESPLKGEANVFIFPSLETGNIGYKMVQRLGGFEAIGPILQGLNMPVNDLSRGCNAEDVYKLALITAMQAL
jgi:phosphate acetyltransferase